MKINKIFMIKIILCLELIIYITINYLDLNYSDKAIYSDIIKYMGILLCLLLTFLIGEDGYNKKDTRLLQLAITLTAIADLCLLFLNKFTLGVFIFCFVQITYIIRHSANKKRNIYDLIIFILMVIFISTIYTYFEDYSLIFIASIYAVLIIYSVYTAWQTFSRKIYPIGNCYLIAIAMTLFLLCDINVAVKHISKELGIFHTNIGMISSFLVWAFYLPSQVFLAISGYNKSKLLKQRYL